MKNLLTEFGNVEHTFQENELVYHYIYQFGTVKFVNDDLLSNPPTMTVCFDNGAQYDFTNKGNILLCSLHCCLQTENQRVLFTESEYNEINVINAVGSAIMHVHNEVEKGGDFVGTEIISKNTISELSELLKTDGDNVVTGNIIPIPDYLQLQIDKLNVGELITSINQRLSDAQQIKKVKESRRNLYSRAYSFLNHAFPIN